MRMRQETDSLGPIQVPADKYWGAQTQRALEHFSIGNHRMARAIIHALALVKRVAAEVNAELGRLDPELTESIRQAAKEVETGLLDEHFPLGVWQSGSGTQTNMNLNEVIANRAIEILGGRIGSKIPVHPNDHVNLGQSTNDTFPTALHIATVSDVRTLLIPRLEHLKSALAQKAEAFAEIVKVGRTHLMDAAPLTLKQEFSGYAAQVDQVIMGIQRMLPGLYELAQGGTAVGTGLNSHPDFASRFAAKLAECTGYPFQPAPNKFAALAAHDPLIAMSGALRAVAVALFKIASDFRLLASGPRCGLGELILPANEPGSSIMPGKVNPTQVEALTMVCAQVIGNDTAVTIGGMNGQLELNVFKPLIGHNVLESIRLLADVAASFADHCVAGVAANLEHIAWLTENNLMLVTALAPVIGHDKAAQVAQKAHAEGTGIKAAAIGLGFLSEDECDRYLHPEHMVGPA
jgi:fumarate hydratase class II